MQIIGPDKAIETVIFKGILEDMEDKLVEEDIEMIGHLQEIMVVVEIEVQVTADQGQDLELVQIEIG